MSGVAKPSAQEQCDNSRLRAVRAFCMATLRQLCNNFVRCVLSWPSMVLEEQVANFSMVAVGASACSKRICAFASVFWSKLDRLFVNRSPNHRGIFPRGIFLKTRFWICFPAMIKPWDWECNNPSCQYWHSLWQRALRILGTRLGPLFIHALTSPACVAFEYTRTA